MRGGSRRARLGDVAEFIRGITFKPEDLVAGGTDDAVVCMRTKNVQTLLDEADILTIPRSFVRREKQFLGEGDLLMSTANSWNLVGKACWVPSLCYSATAGGFISILRANEDVVDPRYLYYWTTSPETQAALRDCGRQTTNISNLDFRRAESLEIPLPESIAEQKRLAAILDHADGIRRKRQQALRLTDEFLRSVFLDMFGDPVSNPKGWSVDTLQKGVESFDGGWNVLPTETERSDGYKVLKVSAVTSGEYRPEESKSFAESVAVPEDYLVREGDLIISRANTAELVGAVAYVWSANALRMLPDKLWRFVWKKPQVLDPLFMLHLARSSYFRDQLIQRASGSSGSMKNIGKAKMMEIPIPYPPIELQNRFSAIVRSTRHALDRAKAATLESESLFQSLQHRAFSGQL